MSFAEAIRSVLNKYADFSGRARRSEYWFWALALLLAYLVAVVFYVAVQPVGVLLYIAIVLGAFIPSLAVTVRRLHDTGKSGWFVLFGLIPVVGGIIMLVFTVSDSAPVPNRYGDSPKGDGGSYGYGYGQAPAL